MMTSTSPFSPQRDNYILMRRRYPSPMQGATVDRAAEVLTISGFALSDLSTPYLVHLLRVADLSRVEFHAVGDALRRRYVHATNEEDLTDLCAFVDGKVVTP